MSFKLFSFKLQRLVKPYYIKAQRCSQTQKTHLFAYVLEKQLFLKVLQNLQENICVEVTFNEVAGIKRVHQKCSLMNCFL